jgi:hypothetical protein
MVLFEDTAALAGTGIDAERVEHSNSEVAGAIRDAVPDVTEVFLDATPGRR